MINNTFMKKNPAKVYIIAVLLITWSTTSMLFINPDIGKRDFALIMFIPAILAIIFNKITNEHSINLFKNTTLKSALFGILYPIVFISVCSLIAKTTGIGKININEKFTFTTIITVILTAVIGLFSA